MRQLLRLATITQVLLLAATTAPAHAGQFAVEFQGVAWGGSSLDGKSLLGDSFTLYADFDSTTGTILQQGVVEYAVTAIGVSVGGTSYSVTTPLSNLSVYLIDATNTVFPGVYSPEIYNSSNFTGFGPAYSTATPSLSAANPTPTVFSGYLAADDQGNVTTLSTVAGTLTLTYYPYESGGVNASINSVPEPSSLALCVLAGSIGLVVAWRRRKGAA